MAERNTSPANSSIINNKWEFGVNSVIDIHQSRMSSQKEELVNCGSNKGNVGREEHAQVLLG